METAFQESPEKWMIETYTAKPQGGCPCLHCFCSCSKVVVEKLIIHWILRALEQNPVCWEKKKKVFLMCPVIMLGFISYLVVSIPNFH